MGDYWNHNTAYHPEVLAAVASAESEVLDIGCGDGLLVQRLAQRAGTVTGIDPDAASIALAASRVAETSNVRLIQGDFLDEPELDGARFDLITCVAVLHHLPLAAALRRMKTLLKPGGRLLVVGLAANKSAADWIISGLQLYPIRWMSRIRGESGYQGMVTSRPAASLDDIRRVAARLLPGSRVRRRFYYRYTLEWRKPPEGSP